MRVAGRARWPSIDVPVDALARHITEVPSSEHQADVYLALACAAGDRHALAAFEREFVPALRITLARAGVPAFDHDDVLQGLRTRLMVGTSDRPAMISSYLGDGALSSWLRVCGARVGIDYRRSRRPPGDSAEQLLGRLAAGDPDLERVLASTSVRNAVRAAFRDAISALEPRSATVLRCRVLDGVTSQELADAYDVHRATVDRWLAAAKDDVLRGTRTRLMHAFGVSRARAQSMIALVTSRLDIGISTLFESADPGDSPAS